MRLDARGVPKGLRVNPGLLFLNLDPYYSGCYGLHDQQTNFRRLLGTFSELNICVSSVCVCMFISVNAFF